MSNLEQGCMFWQCVCVDGQQWFQTLQHKLYKNLCLYVLQSKLLFPVSQQWP